MPLIYIYIDTYIQLKPAGVVYSSFTIQQYQLTPSPSPPSPPAPSSSSPESVLCPSSAPDPVFSSTVSGVYNIINIRKLPFKNNT